MVKRRTAIIGLGSLAFGSGALSTMASFSGDFAEPDAQFRVIADAALRVRSARDGNDNPIVSSENPATDFGNLTSSDINITDTGYSTDYSTFRSTNLDPLISNLGAPRALGAEINQGANNQLKIRTGISLRDDDEIAPLIEIENNSDTNRDIKINFAENDGSNNIINSNNGYGSNVYTPNDGSDATAEDLSNGKVSRQTVQTVWRFRADATDYNGRNSLSSGGLANDALSDGDLISPNPSTTTGNPDEADSAFTLSAGELIMVKLDYNTDKGSGHNIVSEVNQVAGGGSTNPFATNDDVDLLESIFITAS